MKSKKMQYLVEGISKDIVCYLIEDEEMDVIDALVLFHNSATFEKLCHEESGLYIESAAYVYDIFKSELKHGKITNVL